MGDPTSAELLQLQEALYTSKNPTRQWLHVSRRDWVEEAILRLGAGVERALEVGPGSGVYLPVLLAVAGEVVASDIEDAYLAKAEEIARFESGLSVVSDDITATQLPEGYFQLVLCTEVIEHIADSNAAIAGLSRLPSRIRL